MNQQILVAIAILAIVVGYITIMLAIFDSVEKFGDSLHDYFEDTDN